MSFENTLTSLGEEFDNLESRVHNIELIQNSINSKLDQIIELLNNSPVFKFTITPEESDPYEGVFIPEFKTKNPYVVNHNLVGYTERVEGVKEPLYVVTFDDAGKRSYTHDVDSVFHSVGKNIYDNLRTVIVDTSHEWSTLVIDQYTKNDGVDPDPFAANLN